MGINGTIWSSATWLMNKNPGKIIELFRGYHHFPWGQNNAIFTTQSTGNGNHTTYKNGDDWRIVYYCFPTLFLMP